MSINKSILYLILISASFSAYSQFYEVTITNKRIWDCAPSVGSIVTIPQIEKACLGTASNQGNSTVLEVGYSSGIIKARTGPRWRYSTAIVYAKKVAGCPDGSVINPDTGYCESICESLSGTKTGNKTWNYFDYGSSPTICARSCSLVTTGVSVCAVNQGTCVGAFKYTGQNCGSGDGFTAGGTIPQPIPSACKQIDQSQWICKEDVNGDGIPDEAGKYDQSAKCGYSGDKWECYGGSYGQEEHEVTDPTAPIDGATPSTNPTDPDNPPISVNPPPPVDGGNSGDMSGVIAALKAQNHDLNNLITDLNKDNNQNVAEILDELQQNQQHLKNISDSIVESINKDIEIYENMKKLEMESTGDIVDAINQSNELDGYYNDRIVESINDKAKAIVDAINGIDGGSGNSGSISGESCSAFTCEGDEIACYIAKKEWQNQCESQNLFASGQAGDNLDKGLKEFINSPESSVDNLYGEAQTLVLDKYGKDNGFNFDSGCPEPHKIEMGEYMGVNLGSFDISFKPMCDFAGILSVFLHLASFLAVAWAFVRHG